MDLLSDFIKYIVFLLKMSTYSLSESKDGRHSCLKCYNEQLASLLFLYTACSILLITPGRLYNFVVT